MSEINTHYMRELSEKYPDFIITLDQVDPDLCTRTQLLELILIAPNDFAKGFLLAKLSTRIMLASFTGISF